jgi:hypothetical protein
MAGLLAVTIAKPHSTITITVTSATIWLWRVYASFYRVTRIDSARLVVITAFWSVCALTTYALINGAFIIVNTITVAGAAIRLWRVYTFFYRVTGIDCARIVVITSFCCVCALTT